MKTISIGAEAQRALVRAAIAPRNHFGKGGARRRAARRDFDGRKILAGLLVLAGAAGIGYGVSFLVNLVQSCALFAAGMGRLIQ